MKGAFAVILVMTYFGTKTVRWKQQNYTFSFPHRFPLKRENDIIQEKNNLLIDKEQQLKEKMAEITSLEEKLKESVIQRDEQIQKLQEEMSAMSASQEEEEKWASLLKISLCSN